MLCATRPEAERALRQARRLLTGLDLRLHPDKTRIVHRDEGFTFLGWAFDREGKRPSPQAWESLYERLASAPDRPSRRQVLAGWQGYFGPEFAAAASALVGDGDEICSHGDRKGDGDDDGNGHFYGYNDWDLHWDLDGDRDGDGEETVSDLPVFVPDASFWNGTDGSSWGGQTSLPAFGEGERVGGTPRCAVPRPTRSCAPT